MNRALALHNPRDPIHIEYNVNRAPESMKYGGFAYDTPTIGQAKGGIKVTTYILVIETEGIRKDAIKT